MSTTDTIITLVYALIGISGALSLVVFAWGFVVYVSRLGTERRIEGIWIMEWGVGLVITAIILIGVLRLLE
jgi:hypothetical protein